MPSISVTLNKHGNTLLRPFRINAKDTRMLRNTQFPDPAGERYGPPDLTAHRRGSHPLLTASASNESGIMHEPVYRRASRP